MTHTDHVPDRGLTTRVVPSSMLDTLLGGFASHVGDKLRELDAHNDRATPLHPGDPYGRVLAWAWETDRSLAMTLLLDVLIALRSAPPGIAPPRPAYTLEDLLRGLRYALPPQFDQYDQLVDTARIEVPAMYGAPGI